MSVKRALVIGNWKMNLDHVESIHLVQQMGVLLRAHTPERTDVVVAPPFVDLRSVSSVIEADRLNIALSAQHVNPNESGAYTGEISVSMLRRLNVTSVIVGHSERREMFGMDDAVVSATVRTALQAGLKVTLCVGENLETREAGNAESFVAGQINAALEGVTERFAEALVVAYEPIWAIGTGQTATSVVVAEMVTAIREALPPVLKAVVPVLYGGSVKPENAEELIRLSGADGFLVGGASLKPEQFVQIVSAVDGCYGKQR